MNISEIIEDADLLVSNAFNTRQKVSWINQIQYQVYKEIATETEPEPAKITENNLQAVPWLPEEYHEILSLGVAKKMAERTKDFQTAGELEVRYHNKVMEAKKNIVPRVKKVSIVRSFI